MKAEFPPNNQFIGPEKKRTNTKCLRFYTFLGIFFIIVKILKIGLIFLSTISFFFHYELFRNFRNFKNRKSIETITHTIKR